MLSGTAHLWHLLSFAYHQARANGQPADALFRQQQALLRTLPTPSSVMADALKLWWAWRKKTDRPLLRSLTLMVLALVFTIGTIASSIFSSLIVDTGTIEVLVDSPYCGRVNSNPDNGRAYSLNIDELAPRYTSTCYKNGSLPSSCEVFTQPNIPLAIEDAPCPFKNGTWCFSKDAVKVDSGLLDVGKTFGLNVAGKDRVQYRKVTTCAVLPIDGHWGVYDSNKYPSLRYLRQVPGDQLAIVSYGTSFEEATWATWSVSLTMSNITGHPSVGV